MKKFMIIGLLAIFSFSPSFGSASTSFSGVEPDKIFSRESGGFIGGDAGNGFGREGGALTYNYSDFAILDASGAGNGFGKEGVGFSQKFALDFHRFSREGNGLIPMNYSREGHGFYSQSYGGRNA